MFIFFISLATYKDKKTVCDGAHTVKTRDRVDFTGQQAHFEKESKRGCRKHERGQGF
jgi:hypothetical protein